MLKASSGSLREKTLAQMVESEHKFVVFGTWWFLRQ
jgi:hypothetical protein